MPGKTDATRRSEKTRRSDPAGFVFGVASGRLFLVAVDFLEVCIDHVIITEDALVEFGDSSVNFEVSSWIGDAFGLQGARSELAHRVAEGLRDADIEIAFPQLDVHLDREVVERLGVSRDASDAGRAASGPGSPG